MTPEQDSLKLYDWRLTHVDIGNQSWSVTIPVKGQRKLLLETFKTRII